MRDISFWFILKWLLQRLKIIKNFKSNIQRNALHLLKFWQGASIVSDLNKIIIRMSHMKHRSCNLICIIFLYKAFQEFSVWKKHLPWVDRVISFTIYCPRCDSKTFPGGVIHFFGAMKICRVSISHVFYGCHYQEDFYIMFNVFSVEENPSNGIHWP